MNRLRAFVLLTGFAALGFGYSAEDEVRGAEKAWAAAVKGRDLAALGRIFTDDLIYAHATGAIEDKKKYLDRLQTGAQRYSDIAYESTRVVVYGETAVAHSVLWMRGVNSAGKFNDHVMMMHFWVKQGSAWRLAAHQTTKLQ